MTNCFLIDITDSETALHKQAIRNLKKLQQIPNMQVIFYTRQGCPDTVIESFIDTYNRNWPKVDDASFAD